MSVTNTRMWNAANDRIFIVMDGWMMINAVGDEKQNRKQLMTYLAAIKLTWDHACIWACPRSCLVKPTGSLVDETRCSDTPPNDVIAHLEQGRI